MPIRRIRIGGLLASAFVLSFLCPNFTDEALAGAVHQLVREGKSQSQSKLEKVEDQDRRRGVEGPARQPVQHPDANKSGSSRLQRSCIGRKIKAKDFVFHCCVISLHRYPTHSRGQINGHPCAIQSACPFHLTTPALG
jgi:hypothetical protein